MTTTIAAIFVFLSVILFHEFGHFAVAKIVGIKVNEFSIGMGPKLLYKKSGETDYTLRLLPIGGYVKMEGEDEESKDPRSFNSVPALSRIAVVLSGAFMNFILAFIVLSIVSYNVGMPTNIISETVDNMPANFAGIKKGDTIININNTKINSWEEIEKAINKSEKNVKINIIRDNENLFFEMSPKVENSNIMIGIVPEVKSSIPLAIKGGIKKTSEFLALMFDFIKLLFKGQISTDDLSGPVGVVREVGVAAQNGINNVLYLTGFLSVNLGFLNLMPIPALDGSRIVFLIIELIRGKPLDPEKEGIIHLIGFVLLISLMIIVTYKDILRI